MLRSQLLPTPRQLEPSRSLLLPPTRSQLLPPTPRQLVPTRSQLLPQTRSELLPPTPRQLVPTPPVSISQMRRVMADQMMLQLEQQVARLDSMASVQRLHAQII